MTGVVRAQKPLVDFTDGTLFGNDAGEDELPDVLSSYFVDQPAFSNFLSRTQPFCVARSRKGMGKSALISKLAFDLSKDINRPIIINITGAKLIGLMNPPDNANFLQLQNYWTKVICARINYALGAELGFAFSDTNMALVESAEVAGFKERNIVGSLLQRIKSSKIPIEVITKEYKNHEELLRRSLESNSARQVWLLVDDIDSTYIDSPDQRALISTFFSACRAVVREVKGLSIRVSVRTDVWSALRSNEDLDKCEQYVSDIQWTAPELKVILCKKIFSYLERRGSLPQLTGIRDYKVDADKILEIAFEPRMKWGNSFVPPFRPIHILSAGRPRWMSQLCRLAGMNAAQRRVSVINKIDINNSEKTYSRLRLNDIYKEHNHQYSGLEKLIETFSNSPARYTTSDLLTQIAVNYINLVGANNIPNLDGAPYRYPLQLAHFLYKVGFVVGRRDHEGNNRNADFTRYEERPELLTDGRNTDDGLLWEVHPAYREALGIGRVQRAAAGAAKRQSRKRHGFDLS
ncbi:P-loop ATPase, Sll1717 family [Novosphingobium sp. NDB2Meth1]|uniref:P-loop ATPase, Sll1717 family n=1 Tax=Novosphingobium sp. NDB2Meth1 TaxID=1892847 RepID=UPI000ACA3BE3|nr:hypothetical protein [Novosphingobium sp. NDB2Meth1]